MLFDIIRPEDHRQRVFTCSGNRYKDVYKPVFRDDGSFDLEVVDKEDLYMYIQSHADSCDLNVLLERFKETGDITIFNQRQQQPFYGDFLDMPKTVAEMYQRVNDINAAFMQLDPKVREKFNNSPSEWLASYGTQHWFDGMGLEGPKSPEEASKVDEVNKDAE